MRSEHLVPKVAPTNEQQFVFASAGVLALQTCQACGARRHLPSTNCSACLSTDLAWEPVSGRGRVWSWIVMHQQYLPGFGDEVPYVVAGIVLDQGPMLMSTLVDIDPADIRHDLPVEVRFEPFGAEGRPMPVFAPTPTPTPTTA